MFQLKTMILKLDIIHLTDLLVLEQELVDVKNREFKSVI